MLHTELNNVVRTLINEMLLAREVYKDAVDGGKLKLYERRDINLHGLPIDGAIDYLSDLKSELADFNVCSIDSEDYEGFLFVEYYIYESDDDYAERIEKLANKLAEKRVELEKAERTRDYFLSIKGDNA